MKLKLLGVLQDFGTPYASLYRDGKDNRLYVSISQNTVVGGMFSCLLFGVTPNLLLSYFEQNVGLREMSRVADCKYIWNFKKGSQGVITSIGTNDIADRIIEDDMYDSFFCNQESAIRYRLQK